MNKKHKHSYNRDTQFYKFCLYGFFKNLRFFDPFLILFLLSKGLSFLDIGVLYSIREIIILILEIPSGFISDALGRRKILILSFLIYILAFVVFYFSSSYILMILGMTLFAIGDALRTGVHKAMIFQYLQINNWGKYKIDYYGRTRSWSQSGSAVSALIAAVIVYYTENYSAVFIISVIPYLVDMILIYSYPKYLDGEPLTTTSKKIKHQFIIVSKGLIQSVRNLQFFSVLTNLSIYTGYNRAIKDYIQPTIKYISLGIPILAFLSDEKKIAIITGVIYSIIFILNAIASSLSGKFTQVFINLRKPMNVSLVIGLIAGVSIGFSYMIGSYIWPIAGFLVIVLVENLRKPIGVGLVADLSDKTAMATTLSIASQAKSVFTAIIAPFIGWLADIYNPGMAISIMSIVLIILMPFFWLRK